MRGNLVVALLLGAGLMVSGCASTVGTSPKGAELPIEKAAIKFASDVKEGGYKVISSDDLAKLLKDKPGVRVIDTTPAAAFSKGHVPGAVNAEIPTSEKELTPADKEELLRVAGPDREGLVVTYCGYVACRRSHIAAKTLVESGYKDVSRFPGGIVGWKEAGFPVEK